jgi:hypothetical protein
MSQASLRLGNRNEPHDSSESGARRKPRGRTPAGGRHAVRSRGEYRLPDAAVTGAAAGALTTLVVFLLVELLFDWPTASWAARLWALDVNATAVNRIGKGVKIFPLTDHFNPRDYQGNLASAAFGSFYNGVGRTFRGKFVLEF